jgi:hypothetical protein
MSTFIIVTSSYISPHVTNSMESSSKAQTCHPLAINRQKRDGEFFIRMCRARFKSFTVFHRRFETLLRRSRPCQMVKRLFVFNFTRSVH